MSKPEQNQKSENPHASFSDKRIIERLARRIEPEPESSAPSHHIWQLIMDKNVAAIEAVWPDLEKHFRHKFQDERIKEMIASGIIEYYKSSDSLFPKVSPQATDTISNKINALACALHEVEKTVPKAQARYKTQSDDTKESILKALSVLAFEARKECRPLQACQSPFEPKITDNRREPEAEVKFYQGKDGGCYMSIDRPAEEKPTQKYPDEYYNLDHIAKRINDRVKLFPNIPFNDLQKEIRAELNVLEEKL
jgi:hypothetical protein